MEQAIEKKDSEKESKADVATINDNASVEDSPQSECKAPPSCKPLLKTGN